MNKPMQVQTCLNYNGPCEEALDFYRQAFDAEVTTLMWFKDSPDPTMVSAGSENKVMHSSFRVGDTIVLASDGRCQGQTIQGIFLGSHSAERSSSGTAVCRALAWWPTGSG
jgi:PhnB protein